MNEQFLNARNKEALQIQIDEEEFNWMAYEDIGTRYMPFTRGKL